jgi:hypothetical protein
MQLAICQSTNLLSGDFSTLPASLGRTNPEKMCRRKTLEKEAFEDYDGKVA